MNSYYKYAPNVFLAKCAEQHKKGDTIKVANKYGKENEHIVFNLIAEKQGFFYYSIIRADGFDAQEYARRKAEKLNSAASRADAQSEVYYEKSKTHSEFLSLGEPVKVGHHSEGRHRRIIEQARNNATKSFELMDKAKAFQQRAEFWAKKCNTINLSMPESVEYYAFKLEEAEARHAGLKDGSIPREHSYTLTYATKELKEARLKVELSVKLWGEKCE